MSILLKTLNTRHILTTFRALSTTSSKQAAYFFPDFKPGPVPKTGEERIKAAEKYNLLPEEYECYSEGEGYGDYPKLPLESVDAKDPWYPWDNEELQKDINEPVHVRIVNLLPECSTTIKQDPPHWKGTLYFLGSIGVTIGIFQLLSKFELVHIVTEKQYPTPGVTHYTFELDEEEAEKRRRAAMKKRCLEENEE